MDRDMFWLPKLTVGSVQWRLPLLESTAATIAQVLYASNDSAPRVALRQAVMHDPAFALWLTCRFPKGHVPTGGDDLADWLLQDVASRLQWDSDLQETSTPPRWDPGDWSELSERSLAVARRTAQLTAGSPHAQLAELLGLLHARHALLALCGPAESSDAGDVISSCLPSWLATATHQSRLDESMDTMAQSVRQAVEEFQRGERSQNGREDTIREETVRQQTDSPPRFAELLPAMTRTLARLRTLENEFSTALESAKLHAMRELAYGASHEINNPLANISTRAQTLLMGETDPERRRKLATINSQAFRAHEMISDIMLFAKPPRIDPTSLDLAALVREVLTELADDAAEQESELHCDFGGEQILVFADRGHLAVALKSLIRNSLEALGMGGQVELSARLLVADTPQDSRVELVVRDTGPGISPEARSSIFNPFYSGREAGRGLGLGLSKCWRIITLHGGTISLDDAYAGGARFVIQLPVGAPQSIGPALAAHG